MKSNEAETLSDTINGQIFSTRSHRTDATTHIVHHWKISSGEIFEKYTSNNEGKTSDEHKSSVLEEKKPFSSPPILDRKEVG